MTAPFSDAVNRADNADKGALRYMTAQFPSLPLGPVAPVTRDWRARASIKRRGLGTERSWMCSPVVDTVQDRCDELILTSRWTNDGKGSQWSAAAPPDRYIVGLCMSSSAMSLRTGDRLVFDGKLAPGALFAFSPEETFTAAFISPCDFIHLYVDAEFFRARRASLLGPPDHRDSCAAFIVRDALCAQLGATLLRNGVATDSIYTQSVAQAVLARYFHVRQSFTRTSALPVWRLKRVQALIDTRLNVALSLTDLAASAGLSRMHFAAQFKVATGYKPHEYLQSQRIGRSKHLLTETSLSLAEIALSVGFQAQAHFTTVFKRNVGETPGRWRRANQVTPG